MVCVCVIKLIGVGPLRDADGPERAGRLPPQSDRRDRAARGPPKEAWRNMQVQLALGRIRPARVEDVIVRLISGTRDIDIRDIDECWESKERWSLRSMSGLVIQPGLLFFLLSTSCFRSARESLFPSSFYPKRVDPPTNGPCPNHHPCGRYLVGG